MTIHTKEKKPYINISARKQTKQLILDKLAERDIPLTVATIDMDWHWSAGVDKQKKITESGKDTKEYIQLVKVCPHIIAKHIYTMSFKLPM